MIDPINIHDDMFVKETFFKIADKINEIIDYINEKENTNEA